MATPPDQWQSLHQGRLSAMIEVASAAGQHTLKHFRRDDLVVDAKSDDSPVTVADREAEQLVRKLLNERFPDDTVQGEEFAEAKGTSPYRWIVDPIDGTKSFVCGVPLYSTLLALECDAEPLGGVILIPALGEMAVAGVGQGSWYQSRSDAAWGQASVSSTRELSKAVFVVSQVDSFAALNAADAYLGLEKEARVTRSWGDGYGYLLVATGRADLMVDPICNPWDVAAVLPVVNEAGGKFTDWKGETTSRGGNGVGTNGLLHEAVIERLRG
ncbi:histidinol-phosphatase [Novipirellula artificiosorum]|uniref:Histidinol-phosphatase n=1 Tax=Novipirellula artificiosorum TaxID=2528016 RepID=A0A5C6E1C3_9BACT|nr:histidinol-phosphatase [Novipirellula artificiosorum]TWU42274.1 Histidinol-phosphatase [Novipirellula artificiosorum]